MPAYVIFDVEIADMAQYQAFMALVKRALEEAGTRYLARGVPHNVHEGELGGTGDFLAASTVGESGLIGRRFARRQGQLPGPSGETECRL